MMVIGLDVHKRSVTAVAVDEAGRLLAEEAITVGSDELLGWVAAPDAVATIRQLNRTITKLDQELAARTSEVAPALLELPGCAGVTTARLLTEIGPSTRLPRTQERRRQESRREALRCLKRLLIRAVYQSLKASPSLT